MVLAVLSTGRRLKMKYISGNSTTENHRLIKESERCLKEQDPIKIPMGLLKGYDLEEIDRFKPHKTVQYFNVLLLGQSASRKLSFFNSCATALRQDNHVSSLAGVLTPNHSSCTGRKIRRPMLFDFGKIPQQKIKVTTFSQELEKCAIVTAVSSSLQGQETCLEYILQNITVPTVFDEPNIFSSAAEGQETYVEKLLQKDTAIFKRWRRGSMFPPEGQETYIEKLLQKDTAARLLLAMDMEIRHQERNPFHNFVEKFQQKIKVPTVFKESNIFLASATKIERIRSPMFPYPLEKPQQQIKGPRLIYLVHCPLMFLEKKHDVENTELEEFLDERFLLDLVKMSKDNCPVGNSKYRSGLVFFSSGSLDRYDFPGHLIDFLSIGKGNMFEYKYFGRNHMETDNGKDGQDPNVRNTMHAVDIPADNVTDAMNDKAQLNELEMLTTENYQQSEALQWEKDKQIMEIEEAFQRILHHLDLRLNMGKRRRCLASI